MNKFKNFTKAFLLFTIFFIVNVSAASIQTDKGSYNFGETVLIYGREFLSGQDVAIQIDNPNGYTVLVNQTTPDQNGNFTTSYIIPPSNPPSIIEGTYTIYAGSQSKSAQKTFTISTIVTTTTTSITTTTTVGTTTTTTTVQATTTIGGSNGGGTTTTVAKTTTTTLTLTTTSQTTTTEVTTTVSESTTTTISEEKPKGIMTWYIILIIIIFITIAIGYFKYKKKPMDTTFQRLKEKWRR